MRVDKGNSPRSQSINVGREGLWMSTERPYPIIEVIDRDEQDVRGGCPPTAKDTHRNNQQLRYPSFHLYTLEELARRAAVNARLDPA